MNDIQWKPVHPRNTPIYKAKLPPRTMRYLWGRVRQAKVDQRSYLKSLVGNISSSLELDDPDDHFLNGVITPLLRRIMSQDRAGYTPALDPKALENIMKNPSFDMKWWVNFQRQHEFNPIHYHGGVVSYVVWMKIPTDPNEQHNQPFKSNRASDFQFVYTNILGEISLSLIHISEPTRPY